MNEQLQADRESSTRPTRHPSREPSETPSLDPPAYMSSDHAPKPPTAGKLKKPTKTSASPEDATPEANPLKRSTTEPAADAPTTAKPQPKRSRKKATAEASVHFETALPPEPKRVTKRTSEHILDESAEVAPPVLKRSRKKQATESTGVPQDVPVSAPKRNRKNAKASGIASTADQGSLVIAANAVLASEGQSKPVKPRARKIKASATVQAQALDHGVANQTLAEDQPPNGPESNVILITDSSPRVAAQIPAHEGTSILAEDRQSDKSPSMDLEQAPRRRLDWTPPRDVGLPPSFQHPSFAEDIADELEAIEQPADVSRAQNDSEDVQATENDVSSVGRFSSLVGNFGYQGGDPANQECLPLANPPEKPVAKRKRAKSTKKEEDPDAEVAPKKPRKKAEPKPKVPKVAKAPKVPKEPKPKAPKKAKSPRKKPLTITELAIGAYRNAPPQDPTEPPKLISAFFAPRADAPIESNDGGEGTASVRLVTAKPKKSKKKVAIQEPVILTKLESPETAQMQLKEQEWLFGSSSQLVSTESSTELRDLQRALKESEEFVSTQRSEDAEVYRTFSCARVPSAPHGTSLSVGQAQRDLWCSAARDFDDGTFATDEGLGIVLEESNEAIVDSFVQDLSQSSQRRETVPTADEVFVKAVPDVVVLSSQTEPDETLLHDSGYVDNDNILEDPVLDSKKSLAKDKTAADGMHSTTQQDVAPFSQRYEMICIDSSPLSELGDITHREILRPLDPNANLMKKSSDVASKPSPVKTSILSVPEQSRTVLESTVSISQPPEKKARGRPRKIPIPDPPTSPKRRARPPKVQALSESAPMTSTSKSSKPSLSQPLSSPYLDIDDIFDDEIATAPPSPPRRQASATLLQPMLELSNPAALPPANARTNKQMQADFPVISVTLFPRISATVKAARPTTNPKTPSWYEKILLYDPIVLEDLTAWLNAEGVCIKSTRPKLVKKIKGKGKQKESQAAENEGAGEMEIEMEVCREELKPWMVQKWCEENSVCCLWKGGLRGGVRAAY